jgi:adenylyltransferase/sulfurtransferase
MTPDQRERYSRQIRLPNIGETGQERLLESHVAIVGCGALGSFQAGALARAGLGKITLVDRDYVEISNLQRQWLFEECDVHEGLPKAVAAARRVARINSGVNLNPIVADLTAANIDEALEGAVLILDGTDNFETRYLVNDFCVKYGIPWIYGGAVGAYGIVIPFQPGSGPCFRCMYPTAPPGAQPTCETAGVLNTVTSLVASLQVTEAFRFLTGNASAARVTTVDLDANRIRQTDLPFADPECATCGRRIFEYLEGRRPAPVSLCGRNAVQIHERSRPLDLTSLRTRLAAVGDVRANEFALRLTVPPYEMTIFPDGRAIIKGTTDLGVARSLYARYIGA